MHGLLARSLLLLLLLSSLASHAQTTFDVASIRLSQQDVKFEHDGETEISHGTLRMRDVTVSTCIRFAYKVQQAQILGDPRKNEQHYDITAKAAPGTTAEQMRPMLQALLEERFHLVYHREKRELNGYVMTVMPKGTRIKPSADQNGELYRQNYAASMVAKNMTMQELADYISEPLGSPLADGTHLEGKYDLVIDFTKYVDAPPDIMANAPTVLSAAFKGELGLQFIKEKAVYDMLVIDHIQPPSEN
jgi:uncharacterized protein (TIGR03435 family)